MRYVEKHTMLGVEKGYNLYGLSQLCWISQLQRVQCKEQKCPTHMTKCKICYVYRLVLTEGNLVKKSNLLTL